MAYEPTEWKCGDTITAERLNKLEQGVANIGGGTEPLIVTYTEETEPCETELGTQGTRGVFTCSHSWTEIKDALVSGRPVYMPKTADYGDGMVGFNLFPIIIALTDNSETWGVQDITREYYAFADATSKVWYNECSDK